MIVLDTNVLSEFTRPAPAAAVIRWMDAQRSSDLAITSITAAELRAGIAVLPRGRRRTAVGRNVDVLLDETFARYVLPFDSESAVHYAEVTAGARRQGVRMNSMDAQIAAICRQHGASLATRNIKDFRASGVELLDPWRE